MVSTKKNSRNHRDGEPHALKSRGDIIFETVPSIVLYHPTIGVVIKY